MSWLKDRLQGKVPAGTRRSPRWASFRAQVLEAHPVCSACGGDRKLEVHHIEPFHENPERELDVQNVIVLCESGNRGVNCHLHFGHLGNFQLSNPTVASDAREWRQKMEQARGEAA